MAKNRIREAFENKLSDARFIAYICAGDPSFETSVKICSVLIEEGIDLLEIGVPFSDPVADGIVNQMAAERALQGGMTHERLFELVRTIRRFSVDRHSQDNIVASRPAVEINRREDVLHSKSESCEIPIILYLYYNLIFSQGLDLYIAKAKESGVDGILVLDCPPEEAEDLSRVCEKYDMKLISIVAPNTPEERIRKIVKFATGFIYYVSQTGVTGERQHLAIDFEASILRIKRETDLPVVLGFGISNREQIQEVSKIADGVVVGSALVKQIELNRGNDDAILKAIRKKIRDLMLPPH